MRTQIMARLDALEQQSRNTLTQSMNELEGRLERFAPPVATVATEVGRGGAPVKPAATAASPRR
jgi:hypothetical protein